MPGPPVPYAGAQPRCEQPVAQRLGVELASQGVMVDALAAVGNGRSQAPVRCLVELDIDGAARIPAPTSRAKAIAMGVEPGVPFRRQRGGAHALLGPIGAGGKAQRALLPCPGLRKIDPTYRGGVPVKRPVRRQARPFRGRARREALHARGLLAPVVWGHLSHRKALGIVRTSEALLQPADLAVIPTLCGSIDALLERPDLPLNLRPADGMPVLHRRAGRAQHLSTPTHPAIFHTSGRTAADPRACPVALAA
jgi:hypothetical protein